MDAGNKIHKPPCSNSRLIIRLFAYLLY